MYKRFLKRVLDIIIASAIFLVFFPIFALIFFILLIQNKENPFFIQKRVGLNNSIFNLIKFKSMNDKKGADGLLLKDKDRITKFGSFIRKTSLDELPQLINILRGDMSIIGPRPLLVAYLPYYSSYHIQRHDVRPGITGLAQIKGRNYLKFSERFNLDVRYSKNLSLVLDFKIFFKTFFKIFKSNDISMGRKMSEVDDIGITKGLEKHYFNAEEDN